MIPTCLLEMVSLLKCYWKCYPISSRIGLLMVVIITLIDTENYTMLYFRHFIKMGYVNWTSISLDI